MRRVCLQIRPGFPPGARANPPKWEVIAIAPDWRQSCKGFASESSKRRCFRCSNATNWCNTLAGRNNAAVACSRCGAMPGTRFWPIKCGVCRGRASAAAPAPPGHATRLRPRSAASMPRSLQGRFMGPPDRLPAVQTRSSPAPCGAPSPVPSSICRGSVQWRAPPPPRECHGPER